MFAATRKLRKHKNINKKNWMNFLKKTVLDNAILSSTLNTSNNVTFAWFSMFSELSSLKKTMFIKRNECQKHWIESEKYSSILVRSYVAEEKLLSANDHLCSVNWILSVGEEIYHRSDTEHLKNSTHLSWNQILQVNKKWIMSRNELWPQKKKKKKKIETLLSEKTTEQELNRQSPWTSYLWKYKTFSSRYTGKNLFLVGAFSLPVLKIFVIPFRCSFLCEFVTCKFTWTTFGAHLHIFSPWDSMSTFVILVNIHTNI